MCRRYTQRLTWPEIVAFYRLSKPAAVPENFVPRFNIAMTQWAPVVREYDGRRECVMLRIGPDPLARVAYYTARKLINARKAQSMDRTVLPGSFQDSQVPDPNQWIRSLRSNREQTQCCIQPRSLARSLFHPALHSLGRFVCKPDGFGQPSVAGCEKAQAPQGTPVTSTFRESEASSASM